MSQWQWQNKQLIDETGRCLATYSRDRLTVLADGHEFVFSADRKFGPRLDVTMDLPVTLTRPATGERPELLPCSVRTMGLTTSRLSVQRGDRGYVISRKKIVSVAMPIAGSDSAGGEVQTVAHWQRLRVNRQVGISWVGDLADTEPQFLDRLFLAWVLRLAYGPGDLRV